ncbi:hypothetical protein EON64_10005 [archaeon]|nr:MAG: hypothetical protein EON64_10005 [archaeon]
MYSSIDRMFDLAPSTPEDLVVAFEVVEMQAEYNERRNRAAQNNNSTRTPSSSSPSNSNSNSNRASTSLYEDISSRVQERVRGILEQAVEGEYEAMAGYVQAGNTTSATAFIMAANQALFKLKFFQQAVLPCLPPHYDALSAFIGEFEKIFSPKLESIVSNGGGLKVSEILDLITWIEYHKVSMEDLDFPNRTIIQQVSIVGCIRCVW